jgi:hypothetical protein
MVTNEPPSAQPASPEQPAASEISEATVKELARAIYRLNDDPKWLLAALLEFLYALQPVVPNRLTDAEKRFLIESGTLTPETLADTEAEVDRGALQLDAIEGWLSHLLDTISLGEAACFLGMAEDEVTGLVKEGRLYAETVCGRLRFPRWQFDVRKPGKVLPHLPEIIQAASSDWQPRSVAAFMATPQENLVAEGRKTPTAWLRDGGDLQDVIELIELDRLS